MRRQAFIRPILATAFAAFAAITFSTPVGAGEDSSGIDPTAVEAMLPEMGIVVDPITGDIVLSSTPWFNFTNGEPNDESEVFNELLFGGVELFDLGGHVLTAEDFTTPNIPLLHDLAPGDPSWFGGQPGVQLVWFVTSTSIDGAPVAIAEVSFTYTLPGQELLLENPMFPYDPNIDHGSNLSIASFGDQRQVSHTVVSGGEYAQTANPLPVIQGFTELGVLWAAIFPATATDFQVQVSQSVDGTAEALSGSTAQPEQSGDVIRLGDPGVPPPENLVALENLFITEEAFVGNPTATDESTDGDPADDQAEDPPDDDEVSDPPTDDEVSDPPIEDEIVDPPAGGSETADDVGDVAAADDSTSQAEIAPRAATETSSNSGGNGWLRWLLLLGVPVAGAAAILWFIRGRRDKLFADPDEWVPVLEDDEGDWTGRFRSGDTGEEIGPTDPRFAALEKSLFPPPIPPLLPPDPIEANEAMMASVSDEVSPLVEPDDPVPSITTGSSPTASPGPPHLEGPGDDLTDRLRWFAFLDDPPVSSDGWSPVSNAALTTAYAGDVPESVDPDAFSGMLIDLMSGDELHPGDPGYDAAIDELGLDPIDRVDPTVELDERRERERQEFLDRGEPPPPELTKPIGTTDDAGLA